MLEYLLIRCLSHQLKEVQTMLLLKSAHLGVVQVSVKISMLQLVIHTSSENLAELTSTQKNWKYSRQSLGYKLIGE